MLKFGNIWSLVCVLLLGACTYECRYAWLEEDAVVPEVTEVQPAPAPTNMTLSGLKYCPSTRRCSDEELLPPQPCIQPMPTYYEDVSVLEEEKGIVLMHPVTRAKVICYDEDIGVDAQACAERFLAEGYVLITDVPQFVGQQDILQEGTYPARKWRKGETVPRW